MRHRFMIGFAGLLLAGCSQLQMAPLPPASDSGSVKSVVTKQQNPIPDTISGAVVIGSQNAGVTMLLFANAESAYSKEFVLNLMPKLQTDFIAHEQLKLVLIEVPLNKYPKSDQNAHILSCAATTQSGADISTMLFAGRSSFPALKICLNNMDYLQTAMAKQHEVITNLNVTLVPTYFLNGQKFSGLPDYADLHGQIEEAMQR